MESIYKTYLFLYIPEQRVTGLNGAEMLDSELLQITEMSDKFYGLAQDMARIFNAHELKQTSHIPRKLIVVSSTKDYAKEIAQTKI